MLLSNGVGITFIRKQHDLQQIPKKYEEDLLEKVKPGLHLVCVDDYVLQCHFVVVFQHKIFDV